MSFWAKLMVTGYNDGFKLYNFFYFFMGLNFKQCLISSSELRSTTIQYLRCEEKLHCLGPVST